MKKLEADGLTIEVKDSPFGMCVVWLGKSDTRDPGRSITPFLDQLVDGRLAAKQVELDFTQFDYMNSSTIRPILTFIQKASGASKNVLVRYDGKKNWQRLSFKAIGALSASWRNVAVIC